MPVTRFARWVVLSLGFLLISGMPALAQSSVVVVQDAPIMLLPDAKRTPLYVAPTGTRLVHMGMEGDWLIVQFNDSRYGRRNGYVQSRYVRIDAPPAAAAPKLAPPPAALAPPIGATVARESPPVPSPTPQPVTPTVTSGAGPSAQVLTFRKVDYAELQGDKERNRAARLVLDPVAKTVTLADEGGGEAKGLYARIPYSLITKIVYEQSAHRRYGAGVMVSPLLFFTKGKKHWLTIEFQNVAELPQGFVYARLDKDNYRQVLSALRAGTGVAVEEHIED